MTADPPHLRLICMQHGRKNEAHAIVSVLLPRPYKQYFFVRLLPAASSRIHDFSCIMFYFIFQSLNYSVVLCVAWAFCRYRSVDSIDVVVRMSLLALLSLLKVFDFVVVLPNTNCINYSPKGSNKFQ